MLNSARPHRATTPISVFLTAFSILLAVVLVAIPGTAREYHVAVTGDNSQDGSLTAPLATIQAAADRAMPGDVITVHAGTYRERITPPRGGTADTQRIVYQAAPGEKVVIKGSEVIKGWEQIKNDTWKVTIPNTTFGDFNPYTDSIRGDWFNPKGRPHHTGAVYLMGHWLTEAATKEEVLQPAGVAPTWYTQGHPARLLNLAWLRFRGNRARPVSINAADYTAQKGVQTAQCFEGGSCVAEIRHGAWTQYTDLNVGSEKNQIELRVASGMDGGVVELRLDTPKGRLLGSAPVPNTGGWQAWTSVTVPIEPIAGQQTICLVFTRDSSSLRLWYAEVDEQNTTIWAQFKDINPNQAEVEINVRQTVFYPQQPGVNYLTVRGFTMMHAATPWAPPTAEQIGLIGTHWSKGWIIEECDIRYSTCVGITLGKYGDEWDNTSEDTAEGYVLTIERALANGWNKETIGHHIVRNNTIAYCEQAGLVGSLGAVFSTICDNTIHDIHVRRLFTGAEMAGIKIHAAIDTTIRDNHIYRTTLGLWLDWMAQGTRVTQNLFHDNFAQDLFIEVNHGPFLVDNNCLLSKCSLLDMSQGGAYAHNLFAGRIASIRESSRSTPYHPPHTTTVAGLTNISGGDSRFYNNIIAGDDTVSKPGSDPGWGGGYGLWAYDFRPVPIYTGGNVFYQGTQPSRDEESPIRMTNTNPRIRLTQQDSHLFLRMDTGAALHQTKTQRVTTERLGFSRVSQLPYTNPDGSLLDIATDYFGAPRADTPTPGPFETLGAGSYLLQLW
ncbi:MAG: carbohydrate-binding protein [bacterium]|jgi:hypothetical protein|nr:carbohydrate-binding protein [bacterium]